MLELAERVQSNSDLATGLHLDQAHEDHPANQVRSVSRLFCSEVEDKPWYYDKDFWRGYLDVLAASRFNRFNFTFGLGYDFPRGVTGDYFHFPYPYLVDVPGYDVRVVRLANEAGEQNLPPFTAEEREKNLQMLRFIAAETSARGLNSNWASGPMLTSGQIALTHITASKALHPRRMRRIAVTRWACF